MLAVAVLVTASTIPVPAWPAPPGYFDLEPGIVLETGDTWIDHGRKFRLYGVQSCLRGTHYTGADGRKRDCGTASMAVLSAYIKDTHPICAPVARRKTLTYVMCYATIKDKRLDLGTVLISSGYAFAALNSDGLPYDKAYAVAEQLARKRRSGLWRFSDVRLPSVLLSHKAHRLGKGRSR
jgi:endonuclease YncB( thermonuclease family)